MRLDKEKVFYQINYQIDDGRWRCMVCTSIKRGGDTGVKRGVCKSCDDQLKNLKSRLDSLFCILGDKSCHPTRCTGCLIARYVWWAHYPNSPNYKDPVIIRRFELWLKGYEYPIPFKSKKRANHIASLQQLFIWLVIFPFFFFFQVSFFQFYNTRILIKGLILIFLKGFITNAI